MQPRPPVGLPFLEERAKSGIYPYSDFTGTLILPLDAKLWHHDSQGPYSQL